MSDVIGPVIAIVVIFIVYYVAQNIDMLGDVKKAKLDLDKISAKTKHEEAKAHTRALDIKMGELAIEARKMDELEYKTPTDAEDAEFKVLDDKREEE